MMRTARALTVTVFGIALALGSTAASMATPAPSDAPSDAVVAASETPKRSVLGGVNLWEFCRKLGYADVTNENPHNVWTWYCVRNGGGLVDINMYAACQWQYNEQWAKPDFWNEQDEYSWYCYLD